MEIQLNDINLCVLHIRNFPVTSIAICTSEGEMLNTSAILAYSSLTLVNPWMRPVGLPWASWVWKMSLGLEYSGGPGGGGEGGGSGGAVGSTHPGLWAFCSSMASAPATLESCGLISSPFCISPSSGFAPQWEPWLCTAQEQSCPSPSLADQSPNQPASQSFGVQIN